MGRKKRIKDAQQVAGEALAKAEEALAEVRATASSDEPSDADVAEVAEAEDVEAAAADVGEEPSEPAKKSRFGLKLLVLGAVAAGAAFANALKRQRDQELDESLWDDPVEV